ncbi:uncharacterized protein LOC132728975 [Ruditapes philippinarum]|uniref:uncharacterized protein LOC132728975 n=1 Tax=Ruditapes philippinarum TaxID=129788 RepID=UPI00295ADB53|nr:uncharacterized protein LOC132728975 [Ruditapes philippinarum]
MIREILICFMGVNFVLSMSTTKAPNLSTAIHQTREPAEHETFLFKYEPHFHNMIVVTFIDSVRTCYIFDLSDDERAAIHTDAGIRAVELRLLSTLKFVSVTEVTKDQLHRPTSRVCGTVQHYFKQN